MVRELVLWKSGVPIFRPSGGKGREQISAKAMSSSWTKNESSYTTGKVRSILGEPSTISDDKGKIRYYYDGLILTFIDFGGEERTVLRNIKITRDSKYTTVDGVSVGMSEEELTRIYGMADTVYIQKYTVPKLNEEQNGEYDKRMNKTIYTYNVGQNLAMHFMVKCGIIVDIQVNLQD